MKRSNSEEDLGILSTNNIREEHHDFLRTEMHLTCLHLLTSAAKCSTRTFVCVRCFRLWVCVLEESCWATAILYKVFHPKVSFLWVLFGIHVFCLLFTFILFAPSIICSPLVILFSVPRTLYVLPLVRDVHVCMSAFRCILKFLVCEALSVRPLCVHPVSCASSLSCACVGVPVCEKLLVCVYYARLHASVPVYLWLFVVCSRKSLLCCELHWDSLLLVELESASVYSNLCFVESALSW